MAYAANEEVSIWLTLTVRHYVVEVEVVRITASTLEIILILKRNEMSSIYEIYNSIHNNSSDVSPYNLSVFKTNGRPYRRWEVFVFVLNQTTCKSYIRSSACPKVLFFKRHHQVCENQQIHLTLVSQRISGDSPVNISGRGFYKIRTLLSVYFEGIFPSQLSIYFCRWEF